MLTEGLAFSPSQQVNAEPESGGPLLSSLHPGPKSAKNDAQSGAGLESSLKNTTVHLLLWPRGLQSPSLLYCMRNWQEAQPSLASLKVSEGLCLLRVWDSG